MEETSVCGFGGKDQHFHEWIFRLRHGNQDMEGYRNRHVIDAPGTICHLNEDNFLKNPHVFLSVSEKN